MKERLQKVLARAGVASRRHAEELVIAGKVKVNGQVVVALGTKVDPDQDTISVEGRLIHLKPQPIYLLLNKPVGVISTRRDPQGRRTVYDLLPQYHPTQLHLVGRLDYDSEGLILLTNDGELTYQLTHPSKKINKRYVVDVAFEGGITPAIIKKLQKGVMLKEGKTAPAQVYLLDSWPNGGRLQIKIYEGKNRQIRRMIEAVGGKVTRLKREAIGPLELKGLRPGQFRTLSRQEVAQLLTKKMKPQLLK